MKIKNIIRVKQKYTKAVRESLKHLPSRSRLIIGVLSLLAVGIVSLIWLQASLATNTTTEQNVVIPQSAEATPVVVESEDTTENSNSLTKKLVSLGKKVNLQLPVPSPTTTPTSQAQSSNSDTTNPNTNSPTPSASSGGSTQPSATPTTILSVTPVQPSPTNVVPTPTITLIPTSTPTPGPIQSNSTVSLLSASGATPNAFGSVTFAITQNSNGYWNFVGSGSFQMLQPNRPYQLWICSEGCSSHVNARFTTDGAGSGSIANATITYPQGLYPAQTVRVNELVDVPPGQVIPTDSSRCYQMTGMTPCLQSSVSF